ncbi:MAG: urease accessory protein UreF [Rhizobiales bacterium]|nr:urease accessory protein UreF [Hyphomicrobiales bacterium]
MNAAEFQRQAWFSPAFPVGGFAYSHGIEAAVEVGLVTGGESLACWISDIIQLGTGRNDAIFIGEAWRIARDPAGERRLRDLSDLALALGQSAERRLESAQQGTSFLGLIRRAWPHRRLASLWPQDEEIAFPVAVGLAGGLHDQPIVPLAAAHLQAFAGNLLAAALRLSVIGQSEAQTRLAELQPVILEMAKLADAATLDDLGGAAFTADLMAMKHETLAGRLFRS